MKRTNAIRWLMLMAYRESRRERLTLLALFLTFFCTFAIVSSLVGFSRSVLLSIQAQEKSLLGADFVLKSLRHPTAEARQFITELPGFEAELVQTNTMIRVGSELKLVQLRGISPRFPVYGELVTEPPRTGEGAYLDESLTVPVGTDIAFGRTKLPVRGVLKEVPGESGGFGLIAPRVYVPLDELKKSGLIDFGSQVRYRFFFRGDAQQMLKQIAPKLKELQLEFESSADREASIERVTKRISTFLELGALFAFILGAIAISLAYHSFLLSRAKERRSLASLGASRRLSRGVFLLLGGAIGMAGALIGILVSVVFFQSLVSLFAAVLPLSGVEYSSLTFGMLVCGAVLLVLAVGVTISEEAKRMDLLAPVFAAILLATPFSTSWRAALFGAGGFLLFLLCLSSVSRVVVRWGGAFMRRSSFPYVMRFAMLQIERRVAEHLLLLVSVSVAVVVTIVSLQFRESLLGELRTLLSGERPNIFLFDIQPDQLETTWKIAEGKGVRRSETVPVITMRLAKLNGVDTRELSERPQWVLRREYRTTYRESLPPSEKLVEGEWIGQARQGEAVPISLESSIAKDLSVGIGDELLFDIQGVEVKSRVASIREVEWRSGDVHFFVLFPAGVLEDAPQYYAFLGYLRDGTQFQSLQEEMNRSFPNIAVMDLRALLVGVEKLLRSVALIAQIYGWMLFGLALIICAASLLGTVLRREVGERLLLSIGASEKFRNRSRQIEFATLSLIGVTVGMLVGIGMNFGVLGYQLELKDVTPSPLIGAVAVLFVALPVVVSEGTVRLSRFTRSFRTGELSESGSS